MNIKFETELNIDDDCFGNVSVDDAIEIMEESTFNVATAFDSVAIVSCKLPNNFVITETSKYCDPRDYNHEEAVHECMDKIRDKIVEFEYYMLNSNAAFIEGLLEEECEDDECSNAYDEMLEEVYMHDEYFDKYDCSDCEYCPYLHDCIRD